MATARQVGREAVWAPLATFYLLGCAFSWACWLPLLLWQRGLLTHQPSPYWHLVGSLGPAAAAMIVSRLSGGRRELWRLLQRAVLWRVPATWHLVAWLSPVVLFGIAAGALITMWGVVALIVGGPRYLSRRGKVSHR